MDLVPIDDEALVKWRQQYKASLGCPVITDVHEALCQMGRPHALEALDHPVGYAVVNYENNLGLKAPVVSELFFNVKKSRVVRQLLTELIERIAPASILARSDEAVVFPMLMEMRFPNQVHTTLYQLDQIPSWTEDRALTIVASTMDEAQELLPYYAQVPPLLGGIPEERALLKSLAAWEHYRLETDGHIVGVAYAVPQDDRYVSVMTLIEPQAQGQGFGRYLTAFLAGKLIRHQKIVLAAVPYEQDRGKYLLESLGARLAGHDLIFKPPGTGL